MIVDDRGRTILGDRSGTVSVCSKSRFGRDRCFVKLGCREYAQRVWR